MSDRYAPRVCILYDSAQAAFEESLNFDLLGADQGRWIEQTRGYCDRLSTFTAQNQFPRILLCQTEPIEFLAGFMAACIAECPVFLGNTSWSIQEWQRVLDLVQPHQIWGTVPIATPPNLSTSDAQAKGWIMIPTGGSSGQIKFAIHTWKTLTASVQSFQDFFEVESINSCCVLPLYHVSGLMQFLRSLLTHGRLHIIPFANLFSGVSSNSEQATFLSESSSSETPHSYFLSLVPTQLQRLLQQPHHIPWLQQFKTILLGGAPPWPTLLAQAQQQQLNLAPTYGMTETASQVVTLKPQDFLQSRLYAGCVLPHAQIEILDSIGKPLAAHHIGSIMVKASSMYQGYYPNHTVQPMLHTDDLGYFDAQKHLHISGRSSRKIISGGENIFPEEVETALYSTGLIKDVYVIGLPDAQWGEAVTALYTPQHLGVTVQQLKNALDLSLSHYKHPKRWLMVSEIPRNAQGKIDQIRLRPLLSTVPRKF